MALIGIGALLLNNQSKSRTTEVFTETIEKDWDINLPETYEEHKVVRYKGFYGNGVSYIVLKYRNPKDIKVVNQLVKWQAKDSMVQKQVRECFRFLREWYDITIEERRQMTRYRGKLGEDYVYYCFKEADNMSYGIFIWFENDGELHVIDLTY